MMWRPWRTSLLQKLRAGRAALVAEWLAQLRADPTCLPADLIPQLAPALEHVLDHLADGLETAPVDLSDDAYRPLVRELSFLGGWLAAQGGSASLTVKIPHALGRVLRRTGLPEPPGPSTATDRVPWSDLETDLSALLAETYCRALRAEARQRHQRLLEQATPLIRLPGPVPVLLIVGSPDRTTLSSLLGRLLLEVARLGAQTVALDASHAGPLAPTTWALVSEFLTHRKLRHCTKLLSGLAAEAPRYLGAAARDPQVRFVASWDDLLHELNLSDGHLRPERGRRHSSS